MRYRKWSHTQSKCVTIIIISLLNIAPFNIKMIKSALHEFKDIYIYIYIYLSEFTKTYLQKFQARCNNLTPEVNKKQLNVAR